MEPTTEFKLTKTAIPGLLIIDINLMEDHRGYFQEKFQKEKLVAAGFPKDFSIVQQNISYNKLTATMRGIHAEPWDKYISVIKGKIFAAFIDLRDGENFAQKVEVELDHTKAVFVPRGVGNSYQTLVDDCYYQYFVNAHWRGGERYVGVNLFDPDLKIAWPISKDKVIVSEKDKKLPLLKQIQPF
jgi:dTDP-4-dehydrorhamnose 3,5-epimerase